MGTPLYGGYPQMNPQMMYGGSPDFTQRPMTTNPQPQDLFGL